MNVEITMATAIIKAAVLKKKERHKSGKCSRFIKCL
jgi:hypothetical protein